MKILKSIKFCLALVLLATPLLVHSYPAKLVQATLYVHTDHEYPLQKPVYYSDDNNFWAPSYKPYPRPNFFLEYDLFKEFSGSNSGRTEFNIYWFYIHGGHNNIDIFHLFGVGHNYFAQVKITMDKKIFKGMVIPSSEEAQKIVDNDKSVKCENLSNTVSVNGRKVLLYAKDYNQAGYVYPEIRRYGSDDKVEMIIDCFLGEFTKKEEQEKQLKEFGLEKDMIKKFDVVNN